MYISLYIKHIYIYIFNFTTISFVNQIELFIPNRIILLKEMH